MIIDVRGALGNQVLELLVGLARARQLKVAPELIRINTGGHVVDTVKVDWLSGLFHLPCPVEMINGMSKQRAWSIENFSLISSENATNRLNLLAPIKRNGDTLLHVRGRDRQTAHVGDYVKLGLMAGPNVKLIGDDHELISSIIEELGYGKNVSGTPEEDWHRCLGAECIYTSFSSFTVSASLFDPRKRINFLTKKNSNGPASVDAKEYECIDFLVRCYLKNSKWI